MADYFKPVTMYENSQVAAIRKWKQEEPGVISQSLGIFVEPM
ncbi:MAG: hypothetical protein E6X17_03110 [Sporomusaceae bacterium]|nr:hypothetical protein [Sporomusaceae bacterium]